MSGLCGWFSTARGGVNAIAAMAALLNRFYGGTPQSASAQFGAVATSVRGSDPTLFQDDEQLVAVCGRPRFNDATLARIAERDGLARALARGYAERRTDVLSVLHGSFLLAILNGQTREVFLATDRMGTRPLCYAVVGERLVFGSTLDAIGAWPGIDAEIDAQAIYDYVYFHMVPGPQTIYRRRHRLLPGTYLLWRDGRMETHAYWEMQFLEGHKRPLGELKNTLIAVLRESVRGAAQDRNVGAFLSGGTDSSTLAGMLGEVTGEPARTYSIGFEADGYDEMGYARIAARHFRTRHHEYYVTPDDVVKAIPRIAAVHDQPFGNSSAVPTFYCAKLAKEDGIEILLGGDGGDELFGGNARYAVQYLYSLYGDLPRPLRVGLIEPIVFLAPPVSLAGKVQRYMRSASQPMPARYHNFNLLERLGAANVFTADFLDGIDTRKPQLQVAQTYERAHAASLINRMLALDLKFTLADDDLPKVTRSCELAGLDVRFPMLDDTVVAFSAALAPELKLKRTKLRYFFKESLRGFLPDEIIAKKKHGFGLPFGPWIQSHGPLRELVGDSLHDLKGRGIVRPDFIDELLATRIAEHAAYYGTMAWVLMMLEQWFRHHAHAHRAECPAPSHDLATRSDAAQASGSTAGV